MDIFIPPRVFPLPGLAAFIVVSGAAGLPALVAEKVKLHVARSEFSFG
ncbi:hypothetical protein [Pseudomonas moorei]|nr:hypothetical protein [Pseudomonas moorei]